MSATNPTQIDPVAPPSAFAAITPSDSTDLTNITTKGVFVGTGGNLVVKGLDGVQATFAVLTGSYFWGHLSRVMAATTASNLVALGG